MNIFIIFTAIFSIQLFAQDPLLGKRFLSCDKLNERVEVEYMVEYLEDGREFEAEIFYERGKKSCDGVPLFVIGRVWNYEINQDELVTTLDRVRVILQDPRLINSFNKREVCGIKNWKVEELVPCEGKMILDQEDQSGHRTIHQFKLEGEKLIVRDDEGEIFKLIKH